MAIESIGSTEFGDFPVSGNCTTLDDVNPVPIYEFAANKDGAYTLVATVLAWRPGGATVQYYVQATWLVAGGALQVAGTPFLGAVGDLSPADIYLDASDGRGRLLVRGVAGQPVLWRMKGHRFDLVGGQKYPPSSGVASELGDFAVSGAAATFDAAAVPIYQFPVPKDGAYTLEAIVLAWMPDGNCAQHYVEATWKNIGGAVTLDGAAIFDPVGNLTPGGITAGVSGNEARLLVAGLTNRQIFWRMRGARLDLTA